MSFRKNLFLTASLLTSVLIQQTSAADFQWDVNGSTAGLGGTGSWNTSTTFWDDLSTGTNDGSDATQAVNPFTALDNVTFGGTAGIASMGTSRTVGAMTFTTAGYTIKGVGNGSLTASGVTTLATSGTTSFTMSANNHRFLFNGGIDLNGGELSVNLRNSLNGGSPSSATGNITGNGNITLANELTTLNWARFILSGTNNFTGTTTVDGIILDLNSATALGATASNLVINATNVGNTTVIRNTSGGALTLANNNAMNWNGDFTFSGDTARNGSSSGTTRDLDMGTGAVTLGGSRIVTTTANTLTVGGVIDDGASDYNLTKDGDGTLILTGANSYSGNTNVTAGTLSIGGAGSLGVGSYGKDISISGTLAFNSSADQTLSGTISGAGSLIKAGAGNLTVSGDNSAGFSGTTSLTAGTLTIGDDNALGTGIVTLGGGTLSASGNRTLANAVTINGNLTSLGSGNLTLSGDVTLSGTSQWQINNGVNYSQNLDISGSITGTGGIRRNAGNGTVTLSGDNDFSGGFTWAAGSVASLTIASNTALGTGTFTQAGGNANIGTGAANVINANNNAIALNANFSFNGPNDLDLGTGAVTMNNDRTITVNSNTLTFGGGMDDGGNTYGLTKDGNGTMALNGSSTYIGDTLVSAGTLLVNGALGATAVTVSSAATIGGNGDIAGSLDFDGASFLDIVDINDALNVTGTVTFGTGFGLDNITGWDYESAAIGTYTLIAGSLVDLSNMDNVGLANALTLGNTNKAYFESGSLKVVIVAVPEPASALLGGLGLLALLRRRRG